MADKLVVLEAFLSLAATDWSDYCSGVVVTNKANVVVLNTFASRYMQREGGLIDGGFSADMVHPLDDSFSAQFWSLIATKIAVIARGDKAAGVSASNPNFSGTSVLESFDTLGKVGEGATFTLSLPVDGEVQRLEA